jgi:hypothetical protein
MNFDILQAFRSGRLSEQMLIEAMITDVAASVYAYMRMLENAGRKEEAKLFESIRDEVFNIRADFGNEKTTNLSQRMSMVYMRLETARTYLIAHKPEEAGLLQSVNNEACGLIHTLKNYKPQP